MAFGTNYSAAQDYSLIPQGEYECMIANAGVSETRSGARKVSIHLVIRNDVQQQCVNRYLFLDIWRKKEPNENDAQVEGFNFAQLMNVARAARIPDGTSFETLEQFLKALMGRCIRATVSHREWDGKVMESVDQLRGIQETRFPECRHKQKTAAQSPAYDTHTVPQRSAAPAAAPAPQNIGNLSDFEEILGSDGDIPF